MTEWVALIERCALKGLPLIMGIDSNAHSPLWGGEKTNKRGEALEELILRWDLVVVNQGEHECTFDNDRGGKSFIDLTICNQLGFEMVKENTWVVEDREDVSITHTDHKYITFWAGRYKPRGDVCRNLNKANWEIFYKELQLLPEKDPSIYGEAEKIQKTIEEALEKACPLRPILSHRPNAWWNEELTQLRQEMRKASKKRKNNILNFVEYKRRRAKFCRAVFAAKR